MLGGEEEGGRGDADPGLYLPAPDQLFGRRHGDRQCRQLEVDQVRRREAGPVAEEPAAKWVAG